MLARLGVMLIVCTLPMLANANPVDGVVSAGSAVISSSGNVLDVHQSTDKAIIDWRTFNIAAGETTNFHQPSSSSVTLNRVGTGGASQIFGALNANGNVMIINPSGVLFGAGSRIDVNGLVATSSNITNHNFMAGNYVFDQLGDPNASIINNGLISAKDAGLVGLVAPNVINNGIITANLGRVHLASGDRVTVDLYNDGLMEVALSDSVSSQLLQNTGVINAAGGKIALTAAAGAQVVNSLVDIKGELKAPSIAQKNGEIMISGGKAVANVEGKLDASGRNAGEKGGDITVTSNNVNIKTGSIIEASGDAGGGKVKIGGDYQGGGSTPRSQQTIVEQGSLINADAITSGNGGEVIVWSDKDTSFRGLIQSRGGQQSGNGANAEVSGKRVLDFAGFVDLTAQNGETGTLLLDPTDITISNAADSNGSFAGAAFTPSAGTSNINVTTLATQLSGGSNVTISTASAFGGNGDITFVDPFSWGSNRVLILNAERDINVNAAITSNSSSGLGMTAGRDITFAANVTFSGAVNAPLTALAGRNLTVNGGVTLTAGSTAAMSLRAANGTATATGILTLSGNLAVGSGAFTLLSGVDGTGTAPDLTLNGTNLTLRGATTGQISITGFRDITIDRNQASSSAITIVANRDLTINAGRTITPGANGSVVLRAANNVITDRGTLTLNGTVHIGTGNLTLASGVDASGNGVDLALTAGTLTFQGAGMGGLGVTGFRDVTMGESITSSANFVITSTRHLTVSNGVVLTAGAAGQMRLSAAGADAAATGLLTLGGTLSVGSGVIILISGSDGAGSRPDLVFNAPGIVLQGATVGSTTITGFRDVTFAQNLPSSGNVVITAMRHLTVNNGITVSSGAATGITLRAANNVTTDVGALTLTGATLNMGTGTLGLTSGIGGSGVAPDLMMDNAHFTFQGANVNSVSISGFRDITVATNLTSVGGMALNAGRNLTVNNGVSVTGSSVVLRAAGSNTANTGILTMNGTINSGTAQLTLLSGIDGSGNRGDIVLDNATFTATGGSVSTLSVTGFRDITVSKSINATSGITMTAARNLTVSSGVALSSTGSTVALQAANGVASGTGLLTLDGTISTVKAPLTLITGADASGNRPDLVLDGTKIIFSDGTIGTLTLSGFRDITLGMNVVSTGNTVNALLSATRDLVFNPGASLSVTNLSGIGTPITLVAGRRVVNNAGAGALIAPVGNWLIYSANAADNTIGGIASSYYRYACTYGGACPTLGTGNGFLYSHAPVLTVTPNTMQLAYGASLPASYSYTISGYLGSDVGVDTLTNGTISWLTDYAPPATGTYGLSYGSGNLASALGYGFTYINNPSAIKVVPGGTANDRVNQVSAANSTLKPSSPALVQDNNAFAPTIMREDSKTSGGQQQGDAVVDTAAKSAAVELPGFSDDQGLLKMDPELARQLGYTVY